MAKKQKTNRYTGNESCRGFGDNPFAKALGLQASPNPVSAQDAVDDAFDWAGVQKVVLRRERKGRGGKTVTLVQGLVGITDGQAKSIAKSLKRSLGVGVTVEGEELVVQGDQQDRLRPLIQDLGASMIVTSG